MISLGLITGFLAVFTWIAFNIVGKKSSAMLGNYRAAILIIAAGVAPMLADFALSGFSLPGLYDMELSILSGVFLGGGLILLFKVMETEQLTNTVALGEIQPAVLAIVGVLVFNNAVSVPEWASIILIFSGAFMVVTTKGIKINRKMVPALLAYSSWSVYWVLIAASTSGSSTFSAQILVSRSVSAIFIIAAFLLTAPGRRREIHKAGRNRGMLRSMLLVTVAAGMVDGFGDLLYTYTLHVNLVVIAGVLSALGPILVSFVSYLIYKDRLTRAQMAGFALMVVGALLLVVL